MSPRIKAVPNNRAAIVVAGTGSVEGAWAPVIRAVRRTISPELPDDAELANLEMARLVHILRVQHAHPTRVAPVLSAMRELRAALSAELREASQKGELIVRPSFIEVVDALNGQGFQTNVITTNWDVSIDQALAIRAPNVSVFHLHGDIGDPETLYLPSEISVEPYRANREASFHARGFLSAKAAIASATDLIIYGLSLSALDAEWCQVLWGGRVDAAPLTRAAVFDLFPDVVAGRLAVVVGSTKLPSEGITRKQPGEPWSPL